VVLFAVHVVVLSLGVEILEGHGDRSRLQEVAAQSSAHPDLMASVGNACADLIWYDYLIG
jgi:hypothetical protein